MAETFDLVYFVNNKEIKRATLSKDDIRLLIEGLAYAKTKDYLNERRQRYKLLIKKINDVVRGF